MLIRFNITGAIPPPSNPTEQAWLNDLKARLSLMKSRCVVINEGKPNEEHITNFTFHKCHHDEGDNHPDCEDWQEI